VSLDYNPLFWIAAGDLTLPGNVIVHDWQRVVAELGAITDDVRVTLMLAMGFDMLHRVAGEDGRSTGGALRPRCADPRAG
jgi:hypothetical protein